MLKLLKGYLTEFKKIDLEAATIIIYSTLILLFVLFLRRTHFILPGEVFLVDIRDFTFATPLSFQAQT
jgi:hypothetical protein